MRYVLSQLWPNTRIDSPVPSSIYILADEDSFAAVTAERTGLSPSVIRGAIKGFALIVLAGYEELTAQYGQLDAFPGARLAGGIRCSS